jgi:hypothetical protein
MEGWRAIRSGKALFRLVGGGQKLGGRPAEFINGQMSRFRVFIEMKMEIDHGQGLEIRK